MKFSNQALLTFILSVLLMPLANADCNYHTVKLWFSSFEVIEPTNDFDICLEFGKVTGTLNGRYVACLYFSDWDFTSDDIWADGVDSVGLGKYYSYIETKAGMLEFVEWIYASQGGEGGISPVTGGTGAFEGANGSLKPGSYIGATAAHFFPLDGWVCTP